MSDVAADAEDLLQRLDAANLPQSRALRVRLEQGLADMRTELRERVRGATPTPVSSGSVRLVCISVLAVLGIAAGLRRLRRKNHA